jgi:hypothetical protein
MRKTIRMTEGDLTRLVRRIINEQSKPFASWKGGSWKDKTGSEFDDVDFSEEKEFGPDEYDDFMEFINDCDTSWCIKTKNMYDRYTKEGNFRVRK